MDVKQKIAQANQQAAACLTEFSRSLLPRAEAVLASGSGWQGIFPILE